MLKNSIEPISGKIVAWRVFPMYHASKVQFDSERSLNHGDPVQQLRMSGQQFCNSSKYGIWHGMRYPQSATCTWLTKLSMEPRPAREPLH